MFSFRARVVVAFLKVAIVPACASSSDAESKGTCGESLAAFCGSDAPCMNSEVHGDPAMACGAVAECPVVGGMRYRLCGNYHRIIVQGVDRQCRLYFDATSGKFSAAFVFNANTFKTVCFAGQGFVGKGFEEPSECPTSVAEQGDEFACSPIVNDGGAVDGGAD